MTTPADTRISDERLRELEEIYYPMTSFVGRLTYDAITELRERRRQAVTPFLSDIAMKIAVEMEAQAALRTTTAEKAETICDILSAAALPPAQAAGVTEAQTVRAEAIEMLLQADDIWTDYGSGFRIHFSFRPNANDRVVERVMTARSLSAQDREESHSYGDLDAGAANHHDHSKRGFDPK